MSDTPQPLTTAQQGTVDAATEQAIQAASDHTAERFRKIIRRYRNSTLVAFVILGFGTGYAVHGNSDAIQNITTTRVVLHGQTCDRFKTLVNGIDSFLQLANASIPNSPQANKFFQTAQADVDAAKCVSTDM